jgi:hypothetical protein
VKYSDARPRIKSGDLLAFSHGDWKTWSGIKVNFVRIFTRSTYSHVGIAWVVGGRVFVLEAVKPKTRIFPLSQSGDFYLLPMFAPWREETEEFALTNIGVSYSELTAMKAFFGPLASGNVQECAAYAREVLKCDGIDLGELSRPDSVVQAAMELGAEILFVDSKIERMETQ